MTSLLEVRDLVVVYDTPRGRVVALDGVSLDLEAGETLGIVGESGSGKSTLGLAIGRLLPWNALRLSGDLSVLDLSVFGGDDERLRRLRRDALGFVFQNPMTALDPTMRIGRQLARAIGPRATRDSVRALLSRVGLAGAGRIEQSFPHELSGGMAQRAAIGMAIARNPRLIVADEPTASLDAWLRDQILELLMSMCGATGASLVLLSHDLHVVSRYCRHVAVMYGGRIVEYAQGETLFHRQAHPYTRALLESAPGAEGPDGRLRPIQGLPPVITESSRGCAFAPRCGWTKDLCNEVRPELQHAGNRSVLCHRAEEVLACRSGA